jgi:DNA-directed RNA polymerase subunit L
MLRESLKDQDGVLFAAYRIPHPLLENPIFYLRTSNIDPVDALQKAADSIIEMCNEMDEIVDSKISDNI